MAVAVVQVQDQSAAAACLPLPEPQQVDWHHLSEHHLKASLIAAARVRSTAKHLAHSKGTHLLRSRVQSLEHWRRVLEQLLLPYLYSQRLAEISSPAFFGSDRHFARCVECE